MKYIIAYDLGTGGIKTSLVDAHGEIVSSCFASCETYYPAPNFREQRPEDWWQILSRTTKELFSSTNISTNDIVAAACSGHSLGVVPIDFAGRLLLESVPIWSDARAMEEAAKILPSAADVDRWYLMTGNGFPAGLYSAFKILWYQNHMPEIYERTRMFIGTKDYLNYRLTGVLCTDHSYASGSGVYDLIKCDYDVGTIRAFGLRKEDFPPLRESSDLIGTILPNVARELGLPKHCAVAAGGVDNACMAAGSGCVQEGMGYTSLGTSAWVAVVGTKPVLDARTKPYVFGAVQKGMYVSAQSIFSAGNTYRWVRNQICGDLVKAELSGKENGYSAMDRLAQMSPPGANGLIMTPTLAGGNLLDKSSNARGTISGLDLKHTRADIIRASLEGICLGLKVALTELEAQSHLSESMLIVGGGAKSSFWRSLFADIYEKNITSSRVGENAGAIGAMACAALGVGLWHDYSPLLEINRPIDSIATNPENQRLYRKVFMAYRKIAEFQSDLAEFRKELDVYPDHLIDRLPQK
jgi:xylulokinase